MKKIKIFDLKSSKEFENNIIRKFKKLINKTKLC